MFVRVVETAETSAFCDVGASAVGPMGHVMDVAVTGLAPAAIGGAMTVASDDGSSLCC